MTAAPPSFTGRLCLAADAHYPLDEADLDHALALVASGYRLTETEARADLAVSEAARPDEWWGRRWGWLASEVDMLRRSDWRTRDELPTRRRGA